MSVERAAPADGVEPDRRDARYTVGAVLLIANAVVYLASEAITAAAWRAPAYSYRRNYISDLGVPDVVESGGRLIDSPLHGLMNTAFLVHGAVFVLAALLLRPVIRRPRARWAYLILAVLHGVGNGLVGLFHSSGIDTTATTSALHGLGAVLAIGGGNAAAIVVGVDLFRRRRGLGATFIAMGALGIGASLSLLITMGGDVDGIPERISVYTIQAAEILAGAALLMGRRVRT
ncbi:DUF998 domain-containing protein [Nakamurella flava]|uniref:DUF998 domain-containing protein n=1 Tax=Nakamurella flava TaxID=2576308 RepID=UPI00140762A7|nr:DUF998 domain-containing protein [Nakamurella flava]